jgi:hypothetical protein
MDSDAVIDDIMHDKTIMFESVNAKLNPTINPVKDTIASCIPRIIEPV